MAEAGQERRRILWGAGTPRTLRAHWILRELDLAYESRPIGPRTGETQTSEFTAINPSQKIPVLQDGDLTLSESAAIVSYVAEAYGGERGLIPSAPKERARYYQWCFFAMMELDADTTYVIRRHEDLKHLYGEAPNAAKAAREIFGKQALVVEKTLAAAGPYILGERFTGADILLTTCLASALRRQIEIPETLQEYLARIAPRQAYQRALEANQPRK
ncbi:MAG: glutathione S-transferase family protein [Betaproteobacteria bacterium]|nr:glutathione S-transferase family protein [Betaproteobacteria bacterium]